MLANLPGGKLKNTTKFQKIVNQILADQKASSGTADPKQRRRSSLVIKELPKLDKLLDAFEGERQYLSTLQNMYTDEMDELGRVAANKMEVVKSDIVKLKSEMKRIFDGRDLRSGGTPEDSGLKKPGRKWDDLRRQVMQDRKDRLLNKWDMPGSKGFNDVDSNFIGDGKPSPYGEKGMPPGVQMIGNLFGKIIKEEIIGNGNKVVMKDRNPRMRRGLPHRKKLRIKGTEMTVLEMMAKNMPSLVDQPLIKEISLKKSKKTKSGTRKVKNPKKPKGLSLEDDSSKESDAFKSNGEISEGDSIDKGGSPVLNLAQKMKLRSSQTYGGPVGFGGIIAKALLGKQVWEEAPGVIVDS